MSALIAVKIKSSMSQARKVFRFLKFFEEVRNIIKAFGNKKTVSIKITMIFSHFMSFLYYIHDNVLWGLNIGILR